MPTGRDNRFGVVSGECGDAVVVALCHYSTRTVVVVGVYLAIVKFANGVLGDMGSFDCRRRADTAWIQVEHRGLQSDEEPELLDIATLDELDQGVSCEWRLDADERCVVCC